VADAPQPGNAREVARFRGKSGRRRPVPGTSPPSNRPGKQRVSVGLHILERGHAAAAAGETREHFRTRHSALRLGEGIWAARARAGAMALADSSCQAVRLAADQCQS
jgi:hypothetical protein